MDVVYNLYERGCQHLLLMIFSYLDSCDLTSCQYVSQCWSYILNQYFWANGYVMKNLALNKAEGKFVKEEKKLNRLKYGKIEEFADVIFFTVISRF